MLFRDFRQNKSELAQMANQHFLRLDLYPKDGVLEINELTTKFTDLDTDGIWFKTNCIKYF